MSRVFARTAFSKTFAFIFVYRHGLPDRLIGFEQNHPTDEGFDNRKKNKRSRL